MNLHRLALLAATAALLSVVAVGAAGAADPGSSRASAHEAWTRSVDLGEAMAIGRDGKLVVAGLSRHGTRRLWALARYTSTGALDRRFGTGGKVLTDFGAGSEGGANAVAIRPDGKIVVAGYMYVPPRISSGFAIARYTAAGRLDRTFGRNGKVVTYFGGPRSPSSAQAVAIQRDGKVVAVGHSDQASRFALARYTLRGRLDPSFGRGGKVQTDFSARSIAAAYAVAIQPDGKIVVAGDRNEVDFALARYQANGKIDRSFGTRGQVLTKVGAFNSYASALIVQPDGKLVVAGKAFVAPDGDFALVRYSADGKLDPSFGRGGTVVTNAGHGWALAIQRDRKLVTAGVDEPRESYGRFALARWMENGSLDSSFGQDGKLLTDFQSRATANGVVVSPDGKIVAAGTVGGRDFALARYTSSGRLDAGFGNGGKVRTDFGSAWAIRGR